MKKFLPLIIFFIGCNTQPPLTDWSKAFAHAANGKTVRLTLVGVVGDSDNFGPTRRDFSVILMDDGKKYNVASLTFYAINSSNFAIDLSPILIEMGHPPSPDAKIVLEPALDYKSFKIELP
jgi:hypothetical protein